MGLFLHLPHDLPLGVVLFSPLILIPTLTLIIPLIPLISLIPLIPLSRGMVSALAPLSLIHSTLHSLSRGGERWSRGSICEAG